MKTKDDVDIRSFSSSDYEDVIALWRESGLTIKSSDSLPEIEKLCATTPNRLLVAESNHESGAAGTSSVPSMDAALGFTT